jgi:ribosome-binding factor A
MKDRSNRIAEEMKKEISNIIQNNIKDPRLPKLVSVMAVNVTRDLRYAKVFVSVLGNEEEKKEALKGLKSAAGFIRREVGHRMDIRYSPELLFEIDSSIERGVYMSKLINDTMQKDNLISNAGDGGDKDDDK